MGNCQRFEPSKVYYFSKEITDWDLSINEAGITIFLYEEKKSQIEHFVFGVAKNPLPYINQESARYAISQHLYFIVMHLNNKLVKLKQMAQNIKKHLKNSDKNTPYGHFTYPLYEMQYHSVEIITFLRIFLDTCVLFVSDKEYESIADRDFFTQYSILKTPHMIQFLDIISTGSNNLKHLARNEKFSHIPLDSIENPSIILELSSKREPNAGFIVQPMNELIDGTNMFIYRLIEALKNNL